jgi:hypothetical protein
MRSNNKQGWNNQRLLQVYQCQVYQHQATPRTGPLITYLHKYPGEFMRIFYFTIVVIISTMAHSNEIEMYDRVLLYIDGHWSRSWEEGKPVGNSFEIHNSPRLFTGTYHGAVGVKNIYDEKIPVECSINIRGEPRIGTCGKENYKKFEKCNHGDTFSRYILLISSADIEVINDHGNKLLCDTYVEQQKDKEIQYAIPFRIDAAGDLVFNGDKRFSRKTK